MNGMRVFVLMFTSAVLAACGGGDGASSPAPSNVVQPPPAGSIGAAGGTVQGPSGAQVVIPAGALSQNVAIAIAQSSAGAPALPASVVAAGQMFAFTPHGTTFASPVTLTVPFDPAQITAGSTPTLYKTTAGQAGWEAVAGATVNGNAVTAPVTSFSYLIVTTPPPLQAVDRPLRYWAFDEITGAREDKAVGGNVHGAFYDQPAPAGELLETKQFGPLSFIPTGRDSMASGEIFSNTSGHTYWVEAEAPIAAVADIKDPDQAPFVTTGGMARLVQKQSYRKNASNATLELIITDAGIETLDASGTDPLLAGCPKYHRPGPGCADALYGTLEMHAIVIGAAQGDDPTKRRLLRWMNFGARVTSFQDHWFTGEYRIGDPQSSHFDFSEYPDFIDPRGGLFPPFSFWPVNTFELSKDIIRRYQIRQPMHVPVSLDLVKTGTEFTLDIRVMARAENRRGNESYVMARLRDPLNIGGVTLSYTGLTPTNNPVTGPIAFEPPPPPECSSGNDPESGTLQFSEPEYVIAEFYGKQPFVMVTRTGGTRGAVSANVTFTGGSAIAGTHYVATTQTVQFADGEDTPQAINVPLIDNDTEDGNVTVNLALTADPGCATLGTTDEAQLIIVDDEIKEAPPGTFALSGTITGLEGQGLVLEEQIAGVNVSPTGAGAYAFSYPYAQGFNYRVRVLTQPSNPIQICAVSHAEGTVASEDVTNVNVSCRTPAPSGSLDQTFGQAGKVAVNDLGIGAAVVAQSNGRVVVLSNRLGQPVLAAFDNAGRADTSFGTNGIAEVRFTGGILEEAYGLTRQSDDKLIVVGRASMGNRYDMGVARYNANGSIDLSFGTQGVKTLNPLEGRVPAPPHTITVRNHYANRALVVPDGKIRVAGLVSWIEDNSINRVNFAVAGLNPDGSLDTAFNYGLASVSQGPGLAYSLGMQSDGKVVLAGTADNSAAAALARFKTNGVLDADDPPVITNFGPDFLGYSYLDVMNGDTPDMVVLPDDTILIAGGRSVGHQTLGSVTQIQLVKTDTHGRLMSSVRTPVGPDNDLPGQLVRLDDGKLLLAAQISSTATVADFGILRYNADLTLDTTFGINGVVLADFFGARDGATALAVQSDGKIVAVGVTRNGTSEVLGVVRINP